MRATVGERGGRRSWLWTLSIMIPFQGERDVPMVGMGARVASLFVLARSLWDRDRPQWGGGN